MALSYPYRDPFLGSLITQQNEDDALASIGTYGVFDDPTMETLVPLRAYILCCIGNVKAPDDMFSVKHRLYAKEFDAALATARSKVNTAAAVPVFSVAIERG